MAMAQRPTAIGLHVCEQVIYEAQTNNVTLVNCFASRTVDRVPCVLDPFVIFAWLTDGQGTMRLDLVIERVDNIEEVHRMSMPLQLPLPLYTVRCRFRIRGCPFPVEGGY